MSTSNKKDFRTEIERIKRVSDMMCSMHSKLRDIYSRRALMLDLSIMASSLWLVSMVFIEPAIGKKLSPPGMESKIWLGLIAIITFFLSLFQFKVGWKKESEVHKKSADFYALIKRECVYIISKNEVINIEKCKHLLDRYDSSGDICIPIPEKNFLALKKYHLKKVFISRYIDKHHSASILLLKIKFWLKNNMKISLTIDHNTEDQNDK